MKLKSRDGYLFMTTTVKVSVIINAYNYANYIEEAIISALQQTLADQCYEVIVVDDGSTDNTREVVSKYLPNVIYHYQENGGQASALNAGIALARGEFAAFLDADDHWHQDKLSEILHSFQSDASVDVVYHALRLIDEADRWRGIIPPAVKTSLAGKPLANNMNSMSSIGGATSGICWRISALKNILPIPEAYRICADSYLMICAPLAARKFVLLNKPLGFYRIHGNNSFTELSPTLSAVYPKSHEVASHYRRLCLNDLIQLSAVLGHSEVGIITELNAICLADDLIAIRRRSGVIWAFCDLLSSRGVLASLPVKKRAFRTATTILKLLVSERTFEAIQAIFVRSPLWSLVQRYVKGSNRYVLP